MNATASQITGVSIVFSIVCSGADQRKYQSSASLAFVGGIHRWPVDSSHKGTSDAENVSTEHVIMLCPNFNGGLAKPMKLGMWVHV